MKLQADDAKRVTEPKRLMRDKQNGMIGGVCAGLAEYFALDVTLVRVAYVLISIFTAFAGVFVYIILWIVIPAKPIAAAPGILQTTPPPPPT